MSEEYVACDHQDESWYLINTCWVTQWGKFNVENPETFNVARETSMTTHLGEFNECILC